MQLPAAPHVNADFTLITVISAASFVVQAPLGSPADVSHQLLQHCHRIPECRVVLLEQQLAQQAAQLAERDQHAAQLQ